MKTLEKFGEHSLLEPSLLVSGRARVQANTLGLCQSIAFMKMVEKLLVQILKKMEKEL